MFRNRTSSLVVLVTLLGWILALPVAAACYEVEGTVGVWYDTNDLLANYGIVNGTPLFGVVQFDPETAVGSVELAAGVATISADTQVASINDTLYLYSFAWSFPEPLSFSYGDVRFEGPSGWMGGEKIPASLEGANLSWGYFSFSAGAGNSEFWIHLTQWDESTVCGSP